MAEAQMDNITKALRDLTLTGIIPLDEELGRGAYGKVFKVKYCSMICAAKEIHSLLVEAANPEEKRRLKDSFLRECYHCSSLRHPNIVRFIGVYYPGKDSLLPTMLMELMDDSLTNYVKKPNIGMKRKASILYDVSLGLSYLHGYDPPIVHRDLSPNNILMSCDFVAKISDLGVAKVIRADNKTTQTMLTKAPGTVDFMPPEALEDNPAYGTSLDIFSYGGIVLHVVNQEWPTPTKATEYNTRTGRVTGFNEVQRRQRHIDKMTGGAEVLKPLVKACLHNDPSKRPVIAAVFKMLEPLKESPSLVPALQSGCYEITWEKCADLPSPMFYISAVLHDKKVYIMAGDTPDYNAYENVYCYNITTDQWEQLPPPGHCQCILQIISDKLTAIGGVDNVTDDVTKKVSTYINNGWTDHFPNLLKTRSKPGVVSHSEYVIVAGGAKDKDTINNDIEVLNTTQPYQWMMTSVLLPEPMMEIFPTISDNMILIVGCSSDFMFANTKGYQLLVDKITPFTTQQFPVQWMELPDSPHFYSITVPNSHPPVIIGGSDPQGAPISDISMLDDSSNKWKRVSALSSPRSNVAVVPIDSDTILVLGGCTGGKGTEEAMAHSITTVEKGRSTLTHEVAAISTEDSYCIIQ